MDTTSQTAVPERDNVQPATTVLVVIPDGELRRSVEFAFDAEGFAIEECADLAAAIVASRHDDVVCVIVDEDAIATAKGAAGVLPEGLKPFVLLVDRLRATPDAEHLKVLTKPLLGRLLVDTVANIAAGRGLST